MASQAPFISICIPAYKRVNYLQQLLDSIDAQSFRDFEVIVTDDSNDDSVRKLVDQFDGRYPLRYFRNEVPLGSPGNWNAAVLHATGKWIKIMHDDDWFADGESLGVFAQLIRAYPGHAFFFSAYHNYFGGTDVGARHARSSRLKIVERKPTALLASNVIGPPSVTIYRNEPVFFDEHLKWLVDIDFYIRFLNGRKAKYIDRTLINIGISDEQVTQSSFQNPAVEIPEHLAVLDKLGTGILNHVLVYDAYWRLFRNLGIRSVAQIRPYLHDRQQLSPALARMIRHLGRVPRRLVTIGLFSKCAMIISFLANSLSPSPRQ